MVLSGTSFVSTFDIADGLIVIDFCLYLEYKLLNPAFLIGKTVESIGNSDM